MTARGPRSLRFDESRVLILGSVDEIAGASSPTVPFVVLLATTTESPTSGEKRVIEVLAGTNCREMCFSGVAAERMHDFADEVIEELGFLDITTSWLTDETPEEVALYFIVAGGVPPLLLAAVENEPAVIAALEELVSGRDT